MKPQEIFAWVVKKARPRIRTEPEASPYGIPGIYEGDSARIIGEHTARKYGEREKAGPGPRLRQLFTNGPDGQLLPSDARRQPTAAAGPASTKKASKAGGEERRRKIADLKAQIAALKGRKP